MYGGLIGTHQRSFEWYHPRPPFLDIGGLQLSYPLLSQEQVQLRTLICIYWANPNKSPLKNLEKTERGRIQGLPKLFCVTPIITGTDRAMDFKFGGYIYRANGNKSPLKILEKGSVDVSRDSPIFWYLLLSQDRVTLRTSNFVRTFIGSIGTKAHEKCWE